VDNGENYVIIIVQLSRLIWAGHFDVSIEKILLVNLTTDFWE
jgi:hypothetical protein